jgi:2-polyprenyl-3-methyl-5-hydroxy-6-metoxy-1,4-benzoquinol methylase
MSNAQTFWLENLKLADNYNNWIFSQILPHLGNSVMEVGCGNGNFTVLLAEHCDRAMAIDIDTSYVAQAKDRLAHKPNVNVIQADITQSHWRSPCDSVFDSVVMLDVLEHMQDDVGLLRSLCDYLQPHGKLVVKVPALEWLYSPMDREIGHYRRYSKTKLSQTFNAAGFTNPSIWYFNMAGIPGWWLNGKVLGRTTPGTEQVGLFNKLVPLFRSMESVLPVPIGLSLYAVGTKR